MKPTFTPTTPTAEAFLQQLHTLSSPEEKAKIERYFKSGEGQYGEGDVFIGVKMGTLFDLAKAFIKMPLTEIEILLENPIHEARAGAVSIMDKQSREKKVTPEQLEGIFNLYMRRHDRINNWDLVDLGALHAIGVYLIDKPKDILYTLAKSDNLWERRTAIVATAQFIRKGQLDDVFLIAEILVHDSEDLVHKGTGWMLRFAGDKDIKRLLAFLDKYAATMPRTLLRYSIEKLEPNLRKHYMELKQKK
jgi:3-methyladenine DNA glycosylase AlkD